MLGTFWGTLSNPRTEAITFSRNRLATTPPDASLGVIQPHRSLSACRILALTMEREPGLSAVLEALGEIQRGQSRLAASVKALEQRMDHHEDSRKGHSG